MELMHQSHSETSRLAALQIEPRAGTLRAAVLDFLLECGPGGATDEEMQRYIPMNNNTQRPRRVELVRGGHVVASQETRPTLAGEAATVWLAAEFA